MSAASPFPETEARVVQPLPFAMVFLDLKFDDNELEEEFRWAHNEGQIINDVSERNESADDIASTSLRFHCVPCHV
jgi:hypothetical protein